MIESKWKILNEIPREHIPKTSLFKHPSSPQEVLKVMADEHYHFPVILKPEFGERGWMVEKIEDTYELEKYVHCIRTNFLLQEYIDLPVELGVFYYRFPDESMGTISSVVRKELLSVTGDGIKSIRQLIMENTRARMHRNQLEEKHRALMNRVPDSGEKIELVSIGNHNRGAIFYDGNDIINGDLIAVFDKLAKKINGFYYGRFDIRCESIDKLYRGEKFIVLELNGAKSEPAHIYQPGFPILKAYRVLFNHWRILYRISRTHNRMGMPYPSWNKGWTLWKKYRFFINERKHGTATRV